MNTLEITQATRRHLSTFSAVGTLLLTSALLVACGGGGGVSTGGTGATANGLSVGTVTGKGSTIVNGVRFDDSSASVSGADDSSDVSDDKGGTRKLLGDDVKVGMEVEIEHGVITCPTAGLTVATCDVTPVATASSIGFGHNSLVAPITDFVPASAAGVTPATFASFKLLGQLVVTTATTTVNLESLVTSLGNGVVVEVHGSYDQTSGVTTATRIEVKAKDTASLPVSLAYRVRGVLNVAASTIGGTAVDLNGAVTTGLDGVMVRAKLDTSSTPPKVLSLKNNLRKLDDHKGAEVEFEGVIAGFDTATSGLLKFTIGGAAVSVSTTPTAFVSAGTLAALKNGTRVEVEGTVDSAGVLVARKVELHDESHDALLEFEFHGRIVKPVLPLNPNGSASSFVNTYDPVKRTFEVWTTTVPYTLRETIQITDATKFTANRGKTFSETALSGLSTGGLLVIYGRRSADGTVIVATKVKQDVSFE